MHRAPSIWPYCLAVVSAACEVPNPAYDPNSAAPAEVGATSGMLDASPTAKPDATKLDAPPQSIDASTPARDTEPALPLANSLRDDFSDGVMSSAWISEIQGPCTIVEQNGQVRFNNAGTAASHCAYRSRTFYDLRGNFVQQRVPNITNFYPAVRAFLRVEDRKGQSAEIGFVGSDNMFFNATGLSPLLKPYGHQQELWWRLGESNGSLYWETSPDAASWTRKRLGASTLDVSEVQIVTGVETTGTMPASVSIGIDTLGSP